MASESFYRKLLSAFNVKIIENSIWSNILWIIDSKYRKQSRLNDFLNNQIALPMRDVSYLADEFTGTDDEKIIAILTWVTKNVVYKADSVQYNKLDFWQSAVETLKTKVGDCEDSNLLIYVLARLAGIHQYKLFCRMGYADDQYHCYLSYYSTNQIKMVAIDATYYPDFTPIKKRIGFDDLHYYKKPDYIFNEEIVFKIL